MSADAKYKVVMLGDIAVGKTSLVKRFVLDVFDDLYLTTIGVKVSKKDVALEGDGRATKCSMLVWDIGGLTDFNIMIDQYLQGASGAVIVADVTRMKTISIIETFVTQFMTVNPGGEIVIALNKSDLAPRDGASIFDGSDEAFMDAFEKRFGAEVFSTSAKTGENVEALFMHLAMKLLQRRGQP
jgi:small GTP-binding protein